MTEDNHQEMMAARAEMARPGEGHERLEPLVGKWDTVTTMWMEPGSEPLQTEGSAEKGWVLGGRFLREELEGEGPDGSPYSGIGFVGYDNAQEVYQGVWMSDGMTGMTHYRGTVDEEGQVFTYRGHEADPTGRGPGMDFEMEVRVESADRHVLTQYYVMPEEGRHKAFEIVHTRRGA